MIMMIIRRAPQIAKGHLRFANIRCTMRHGRPLPQKEQR